MYATLPALCLSLHKNHLYFIYVLLFFFLFPSFFSHFQETVVVVAPKYVKYAEKYYTRCLLTFSQKCISLKGSSLRDRKRTRCLEWSTSDVSNIECQQCESVSIFNLSNALYDISLWTSIIFILPFLNFWI